MLPGLGPGLLEGILLLLVLVEGVEVTVDLGSDLILAVPEATGSFLISVVVLPLALLPPLLLLEEPEAVSAARMASATISFFLLTGAAYKGLTGHKEIFRLN